MGQESLTDEFTPCLPHMLVSLKWGYTDVGVRWSETHLAGGPLSSDTMSSCSACSHLRYCYLALNIQIFNILLTEATFSDMPVSVQCLRFYKILYDSNLITRTTFKEGDCHCL